jgi:hypothetical protein
MLTEEIGNLDEIIVAFRAVIAEQDRLIKLSVANDDDDEEGDQRSSNDIKTAIVAAFQ